MKGKNNIQKISNNAKSSNSVQKKGANKKKLLKFLLFHLIK